MDAAAPLLGGPSGSGTARRVRWLLCGVACAAATLSGLALALVIGGSGLCAARRAWPASPPPRASAAYLALLDAAGPLLPPTTHAVLRGLTPGSRVLITGDVHGCTQELTALLHRARVVPGAGSDTLVLAGDLVAKGPDSAGVLDVLARAGVHAVRGNHDDAALAAAEAWAERRARPPPDLAWVANLTAAHVASLAALPFSLSLPAVGLAVVHAGAVPGVPLERQRLGDLYTMRGVRPSGAAGGGWEAVEECGVGSGAPPARPRRHGQPASPGLNETCARSAPGAVPWAPRWTAPPHILFGHDHLRGLQLAPGATGLDTGAVDGGWLTGLVVCVPGGRERGREGGAAAPPPCELLDDDLGEDSDGGVAAVPGFRGGARLVWVRAGRNYTAAAA